MATSDGLDGIRGLYQDLLAVSEARLPILERLFAELEARIADFRKLLDKPAKDEKSRQSLTSGKITIGEEDYSINEQFKQGVIQLADALDLDELEAARLFVAAQEDAAVLDRSVFESAVIHFHERRQYLLECLRLVLMHSTEAPGDDDSEVLGDIRPHFQEIVSAVVQRPDNAAERGPPFARRCLSAMGDIKKWLQDLSEKVQSASVLGSSQLPELAEFMGFQRTSLNRQHESLGAILTYLVKGKHTKIDDINLIVSAVKAADKFDDLLVHSLPPLIASVSRFGTTDGDVTFSDARAFQKDIASPQQADQWGLRYLRGAFRVLWLGEYSAWFLEPPDPALLSDVDLQADADARSVMFFEALRDGAFDFLLALSIDVKPAEWYDPVRDNLRRLLQKKSPDLALDAIPFSEHFQLLVMEQLESFVDAIITNMPGTLRRLRTDEDQERITALDSFALEHERDLERFIVMISYVYEHRPDAAQSFWQDPDSNLFGFLQWVSRRLSTPRACAVCEMLLALSGGEENSTATHKFLLEEGPASASASKLRRTHTLSWAHILYEAQYFAARVREESSVPAANAVFPSGQERSNRAGRGREPETLNMLESYLRLMARLCRESSVARSWLLGHTTFRVLDLLFQLASVSHQIDVRGCVFDTLQALLKDKSAELGETVWLALDQWVSGTLLPSPNLAKPGGILVSPVRADEAAFATLANGFQEQNAFVRLLQALVFPSREERDLNDALPFPEHLGASHRMPGIQPFVDFALGRVFGATTLEIRDVLQARVLRLTCLEFIMTSLSTFNEDLIVFANRSNVPVDSAIRTSSLAAYARLHPFGRVMEWLFNDRVIEALFASAHQDVAEVSSASADSPLLLSLVCSIQVITTVLSLQSTYLDVVRPLVKSSSPNRGPSVANASLASFEDAILNRLEIAVDLGLYCAVGHQELTIASLNLLEKLSTSRKLIASPSSDDDRRLGRNKIIGIWEMKNESDRIAKTMVTEMQPDPREISNGPESPGYVIKTNIVGFLDSCLGSLPNQPTVAHLLLGFSCTDDSIDVSPNGPFARDLSLFHSLLRIVAEYPDGMEDTIEGWLVHVKQAALHVLWQLWRAPLSAVYTMTELRAHDFLFVLFVRQPAVGPKTLFDGYSVLHPDFLFEPSAACFESFLQQRTSLLNYSATEIRLLAQERAPTLKARILATLLGNTMTPEGEQLSNPSVFDFFDFMELEVGDELAQPSLRFFAEVDFSTCMDRAREPAMYDTHMVRQILTLRQNQLRRTGVFSVPADEQEMVTEAESILAYLQADNQRRRLLVARLDTLKAWVQLVMVMLAGCDFDAGSRTAFVLQALQVVLPKLEKSSVENATEAAELARLAKALLASLGGISSSLGKGRAGDVASDRLFQLFRASLRGALSPVATNELRETFYSICYRYLVGISESPDTATSLRRHSAQTIKASGTRLIDVVCDDAYAGEGTCRISALLLIDALVSLEQHEDSKYVLESLARLNFIGILVDAIKHIPSELRETEAQDVPLLLSYYEAKLSLLLRVSRTRLGAMHVLNAGLFQSVRDSQLFAIDPDLGLDIDDEAALKRYYELLLWVIRVISSVVLSRGPQNEQTMEQGRRFLSENRSSMVAIFKRSARIGGVQADVGGAVDELVENFVLLITMTDFLDFEEESSIHRKASKVFT
ncbi:MAG: hypothetical protein M1832_004242 [Thelocarpon impressellum]|nr:MAG: hypothetical protein M1832_004242 [Thelocarpon impressellum]